MHILLNSILQGAIVAAATAGAGCASTSGARGRAHGHAVCWTALAAILGGAVCRSGPVGRGSAARVRRTSRERRALSSSAGAPAPPLFSRATSVTARRDVDCCGRSCKPCDVVRDVRWLQRARRRCRRSLPGRPNRGTFLFHHDTTGRGDGRTWRGPVRREVRAAAVLGGGRPVIGLQPARLVHALSDSELNAVLVHELAHVPLGTIARDRGAARGARAGRLASRRVVGHGPAGASSARWRAMKRPSPRPAEQPRPTRRA